MLLTDLLSPDRVKIPLVGSTKEDLLRELVDALGTDDPSTAESVLEAVRQREAVLSTGIGNGVAIPHGKTPGANRLLLAAGVAPQGAEFEALDGKPVQLFFLLVGPESAAGDHVKALSRIARLVQRDSFRRRLVEASSPQDFYAILTEAESS